MHCEICGKAATVHTVEPVKGVMRESHRCAEHAGGPASLCEAALERFVEFVRSERRMPTMSELRALDALGLLLPHPGGRSGDDDLDVLRLVADQVLSEPPSS